MQTVSSHFIRQANPSAFLKRMNAGLGESLLKIHDEDTRSRVLSLIAQLTELTARIKAEEDQLKL